MTTYYLVLYFVKNCLNFGFFACEFRRELLSNPDEYAKLIVLFVLSFFYVPFLLLLFLGLTVKSVINIKSFEWKTTNIKKSV